MSVSPTDNAEGLEEADDEDMEASLAQLRKLSDEYDMAAKKKT